MPSAQENLFREVDRPGCAFGDHLTAFTVAAAESSSIPEILDAFRSFTVPIDRTSLVYGHHIMGGVAGIRQRLRIQFVGCFGTGILP
jgi:hypothetical protein